MNIFDVLQALVDQDGSDIHIIAGSPIMLRVEGQLRPMSGSPVLQASDAEALVTPLLTQEQKDYVRVNKELDMGYQYKDFGRFRTNIYHTRGTMAAALRLIPDKIKTIEELKLPKIFHSFTKYKQGLILVTGPTGEGKSSTLAAMIDEINHKRAEHIVTIEDPIEFVYKPDKSIISQREINHDTHGWDIALKSALREDPDVVLIGEMRDYETIASAMTIAETGHLVLSTLHTSTASQTIDRIVDVFPSHQQGQIRQQLASTIKVIASQRLLPRADGGRRVAVELMIGNPAISNLIRESKTHQIDNVIQTSADAGMMLFESHLLTLIQQGVINKEVAINHAFRPDELNRLLGSE